MQGHGNLFWDIQFDISATEDAGYSERTHVVVCGHDYKDTYERAQKLYNLAHKAGQAVSYFSLYLRFDEASENGFEVLKSWYLADPDDPGAFFCGVPEMSMKALRCAA